jgi:hypothetical protein
MMAEKEKISAYPNINVVIRTPAHADFFNEIGQLLLFAGFLCTATMRYLHDVRKKM